MKISIITPTNNPKYLKELENTILVQTHSDWEWVIVLNNGAEYQASDHRIKIYKCPFESDSVGRLKKYACSLATSEVIAEVDHDDMITPDCLSKLVLAFQDPAIGFVYSDSAKLLENRIFTPYLQELGWTYKFFTWRGQRLYSMVSQPLYPGRFGYVWFAPDHIRAWRKSAYDSIGGHNEQLTICDDQDLMHRLYQVTRFFYIPEVLYIYRISGNNTWLKRCDELQEKNMEIYQANIRRLAERFADLNNLAKIKLEDVFSAIGNGVAMRDESAGVVYADNLNKFQLMPDLVMHEIHRILATGGLLIAKAGRINSPYTEEFFKSWTKESAARKAGNKKLFRACRMKVEDDCIEVHLEKLEPINN